MLIKHVNAICAVKASLKKNISLLTSKLKVVRFKYLLKFSLK